MIIDVITYCSFNRELKEPYNRFLKLIDSVQSQTVDVSKTHILLNGILDYAEHPNNLIEDIKIHPEIYTEKNNIKNTGAMNYLLKEVSSSSNCDFICFIQPSVILRSDFIESIIKEIDSEHDIYFGSILSEKNPNSIWANGHYFKKGLTLNKNYKNSDNHSGKSYCCCSCFVIRRASINKILNKYDQIINNSIKHYGDCTDLAIKTLELGIEQKFCQLAKCTKRWPEINKGLLPTLEQNMKTLYTKEQLYKLENYYS